MSVSGLPSSPTLQISALGRLSIQVNGDEVQPRVPAKAGAIVVYLAESGGSADRAKLAHLLWSDQTDDQARANLRVVLSRLRASLGDAVRADRNEVWFDTDWSIDTLAAPDVDALADAHPGYAELLEGWEESGAPLFDEWLAGRRGALRGQRIDALKSRVRSEIYDGDAAQAVRLGQVLVDLDPWNEDGHRLLLEALATSQGRPAALLQFDQLEKMLSKEFGVSPEPETIALIDRISARRGEVNQPRDELLPLPALATPRWPTRFFGRQAELDELKAALGDTRVLAVVGPGGIGKTRLLSALAAELHASGQRVIYVSFDEHDMQSASQTPQVLAQVVLGELGVPIDQSSGAFATLQRTLVNGPAILCLDNVEVLNDLESSLLTLCQHCPELRTVVTTQRHLDLVSALSMELRGLETEGDGDQRPAALELFTDRVRFGLETDEDLSAALQVCRSVDGHPLAIELAAQWVSRSSVQALLDLLSAGSDLSTRASDLPARHRNLNALVEAAIGRVSEGARRSLALASTFAGEFDLADLERLEAGESTALAGWLSELAEHSLVRTHRRWFSLHPLIKRFARSHLVAESEWSGFQARHARAVLGDLMTADFRHDDPRWRRRAEDLRLAILQHIDGAESETLMPPLIRYLGLLRTWGWHETGSSTIRQSLDRNDLSTMMRAELHRHEGEAMLHAGRTDEALTTLEAGLAEVGMDIPASPARRRLWVLRQLGALGSPNLIPVSPLRRSEAAERARIMSLLGEVFYVSDRRGDMIMFGVGSLRAGRLSRNPMLMAAGDAALSITAQLAGSHGISDRYRRRATRRMASKPDLDDPFTASETLGILALIDASAGRMDDSREVLSAADDAARSSGRTRYSGQLAILEALIDHFEMKPQAAADRLDELEPLMRQSGFGRGVAWAHAARAEAVLSLGETEEAHASAIEALRFGADAGALEDESRAHVLLGRVALIQGRVDDAVDHLVSAAPGLRGGGAQAIQHSDAHSGAVVLAESLEGLGRSVPPGPAALNRRLARFVRAVPAARGRVGVIRDLHAV